MNKSRAFQERLVIASAALSAALAAGTAFIALAAVVALLVL